MTIQQDAITLNDMDSETHADSNTKPFFIRSIGGNQLIRSDQVVAIERRKNQNQQTICLVTAGSTAVAWATPWLSGDAVDPQTHDERVALDARITRIMDEIATELFDPTNRPIVSFANR